MMSRTPATNQAKNSESLLRHDLEGFSRDLLGLHTRFQEMFPVLANSSESASTSTPASATAAARSVDPFSAYLRDVAARNPAAIPPSPAITSSQSTADLNLTARLDRIISQEVTAKVQQEIAEIKVRLDTQKRLLDLKMDDIYPNWIQPLQAQNQRIEEELAKMRAENLQRQQAQEKMREELLRVIWNLQTEIDEMKKGRVRKSVEERESRKEIPPTPEDWAALEAFELSPKDMRGPTSREENVQNYTSSALVPFSSQVEKKTNDVSSKEPGQHGTPASVVSGLDLTTRPANRGQQIVASLQNTHRDPSSANSELPIPATKRRSHSGRHSATRLASDSDDDNYLEATTSANRGSTSQSALRPGRHSQGTAATTRNMSRSRSPRPSLDANFRVRDRSQSAAKSNPRSAHRRSTSPSSIESIPNHDTNLSSQSIPSRWQPSRRTKTANELIDKHLSFIPNGWRTIIANTAKQLSAEDWDRSDARVLKKLEEHCPAFSNLEEILPDVRMAVPALRELMRELGRHP